MYQAQVFNLGLSGILIWGILMGFFACSKSNTADSNPVTFKPNIILIMADDLGMETLRTYGGESYQTPNIDQLAASGMQFQQCYSTPLCTPSRVQIMTGKYNFRNYIGFGLLDSRERTFGHQLKEAGYATSITGKWQLYGNQRQQDLAGGKTGTLPVDAGFDSYRLWQVQDRGWRYKTPTVETFDEGLQTRNEGYGPDMFVEFIESFMTKNKHQPFFVYYPMCLVHDPFLPTPDNPEFESYQPEANMNDTTYFKDMMSYMDKLVGRIVDKVDELGIRDNTVIIFTGDNGTDRKVISRWNGQLIPGRKGYTVKTGTHVPLIVNWKETIAPGQKNNNLIDFTDFYPTLMDIAGTEEQVAGLDGLSFYPQLLGKDSEVRDWIFCHYDPRWGKFTPRTYVQDTEWKLYDDGAIFNIATDPLEQNQLSEDQITAEQQKTLTTFRRVLNQMSER